MISISETRDCKVIETPGWTLQIMEDGIRLLPPAAWLLELMELIESKTISHAAAKTVLETWQRETMAKIGCGMDRLRNMGAFVSHNA